MRFNQMTSGDPFQQGFLCVGASNWKQGFLQQDAPQKKAFH